MKPISYKTLNIHIYGPTLLLHGPIGLFFSRFYNYLNNNNVEAYKIMFPLKEFGFKKNKCVYFSKDITMFKSFIKDFIITYNIKHIFMYGNVLIPHKDAIDVVNELNRIGYQINYYIFELGYLRPNFVTIENSGLNYTSSLNLPKEFYLSQSKFTYLPSFPNFSNVRIYKIWKLITFIQHAYTNYNIVSSPHKLQPKPAYLYFQVLGFIRKYIYLVTERRIRSKLLKFHRYFLVILQVSTDSQLINGSNYSSVYEFIQDVIVSFANNSDKSTYLYIKHHPRDRGYNNYSNIINKLSIKYDVKDRIFYFHDIQLSKVFTKSNCKGVVLINSTVGFQALYHSIPLKALGSAPYRYAGLTDPQSLDEFWINPKPVNKDLFNSFYKYTLEKTQVYGNFDGFFPFEKVFIIHRNQ